MPWAAFRVYDCHACSLSPSELLPSSLAGGMGLRPSQLMKLFKPSRTAGHRVCGGDLEKMVMADDERLQRRMGAFPCVIGRYCSSDPTDGSFNPVPEDGSPTFLIIDF